MNKQKRVLLFYSRLPCPGLTFKSRLGKQVENQEAVNKIAIVLILDLLRELVPEEGFYDFVYYYQPGSEDDNACIRKIQDLYPQVQFIAQDPDKDTEAIGDAFTEFLQKGYEKIVMIGSDLPLLSKDTIHQAFLVLEKSDVVMNAAEDNGYGLIGINGDRDVFSDITNWKSRTEGYHLVNETRMICNNKEYTLTELQPLLIDIDYKEDIQEIITRISENGTLKKEFQYLSEFYNTVVESNIL